MPMQFLDRLLDLRVRAVSPYVAIVAAGAEAAQLEARLEAVDREATDRKADTAALVITQMLELV
jgi:hypothetical protein